MPSTTSNNAVNLFGRSVALFAKHFSLYLAFVQKNLYLCNKYIADL